MNKVTLIFDRGESAIFLEVELSNLIEVLGKGLNTSPNLPKEIFELYYCLTDEPPELKQQLLTNVNSTFNKM